MDSNSAGAEAMSQMEQQHIRNVMIIQQARVDRKKFLEDLANDMEGMTFAVRSKKSGKTERSRHYSNAVVAYDKEHKQLLEEIQL